MEAIGILLEIGPSGLFELEKETSPGYSRVCVSAGEKRPQFRRF